MAKLPAPRSGGPSGRYHAGPHLPGEGSLSPPEDSTEIELRLTPGEAEAVHEALERLLEQGEENASLERAYRILTWRILAAGGGEGLTGKLAEIARRAESLEQFEAGRDREIGPIVEALEWGENRDP